MEYAVSTLVPSHDVALRVDRGGPGKGSAGDIDLAETVPAQQIAMATAGINIPSDDVTARVDPQRNGDGSGSAREIKGGENAITQQKGMAHTAEVTSHYVAARVDPQPQGHGSGSAGAIGLALLLTDQQCG